MGKRYRREAAGMKKRTKKEKRLSPQERKEAERQAQKRREQAQKRRDEAREREREQKRKEEAEKKKQEEQMLQKIDAEKSPEEVRQMLRRMQQVDLLMTVIDECLDQADQPKTRVGKAAKVADWVAGGINSLIEGAGFQIPRGMREKTDAFKEEINNFKRDDLPKIIAEVYKGERTLDEILRDYGDDHLIKRAAKKFNLDLSDPKDAEDLIRQAKQVLSFLRGARNYQKAKIFAENILDEELRPILENPYTITDQVKERLRGEAEEKVNAKFPSREDLKAQGLNDDQIEAAFAYRDGMIEEATEGLIYLEAAKTLYNQTAKLSPAKKLIWEQYNDMLDPAGEWLNVTDENFDAIVNEVAINAPFIITGVGAALSASARALALRALAKAAAKKGVERTVAGQIIKQTGKQAAKHFLRRSALREATRRAGRSTVDNAMVMAMVATLVILGVNWFKGKLESLDDDIVSEEENIQTLEEELVEKGVTPKRQEAIRKELEEARENLAKLKRRKKLLEDAKALQEKMDQQKK